MALTNQQKQVILNDVFANTEAVVFRRQAERVAQLMQRHAEDVDARPDVPRLVVVEVNVAGDGLRVGWRRVERLGQHAPRPIERKPAAIVAAGE